MIQKAKIALPIRLNFDLLKLLRIRESFALWLVILFVSGMTSVAAAADRSAVFQIQTHRAVCENCPVRLQLPESVVGSENWVVEDLETGERVPAQRISSTECLFLLKGPVPANTSRRFRISSTSDSELTKWNVHVGGDQKRLTLSVGEREVLVYNVEPTDLPEGMDPAYLRSGHVHPVMSPAGHVLTDEFADDHPHQHGIFFAWTRANFEGRNIDFWNQIKKQGTVEHRLIRHRSSGPVFATLVVEQTFKDLSGPNAPQDVLIEQWTVRCFNVDDGNLFEIESIQRCATDKPLILPKYFYGGMAVRGSRQWFQQPEHHFLTSAGKGRSEGNSEPANWVDIHGLVDGQPCGLTIFSHPSNFRSPQPARLHPDKPYFVFAPQTTGEFRIEPGKEYVSRYLYFAHDGEPDAEELGLIWTNYAHPPAVSWVAP